MKFPTKWLKDVVVVKFHDNDYHGQMLVPAAIKHVNKIGKAEVIAIGSAFRHKKDVAIGDFIYVDTWLGNRRTFDGVGEVVTYDGEDVLGKVV
jgi:co-chaperonin GroES (HSP10)